MNLADVTGIKTPRKRRKRLGRGRSSGHGKTCGHGHGGQKPRGKVRLQFEGGQTPLFRRLPKRGFRNFARKEYALVNVGDLERLAPDQTVADIETLQAAGLVKKLKDGVKVLGDGELKRALTVRAHKFSTSAREKIEASGGQVEVIG